MTIESIQSTYSAINAINRYTVDSASRVTRVTEETVQREGEVKAVGSASSAEVKAGEDVVEISAEGREMSAGGGEAGLTETEKRVVAELSRRDREVRQHEMAHVIAAGRYARSGAKLTTMIGPDGKLYATGGGVDLDMSEEPKPEDTIAKMKAIKRAALAPAQPSGQDRAIYAIASRIEMEAKQELIVEKREEMKEAMGEGEEEETTINDDDESTADESEAMKTAGSSRQPFHW